jgi:hypothetical protein
VAPRVHHHLVEQRLRCTCQAGSGKSNGNSRTQQLGDHARLAAMLCLGQHLVDLVDVLDLLFASHALRDRQ